MRYLSLTPEQQRADYRARQWKRRSTITPADPNAQLHYLKLSLEERGQTDQALKTGCRHRHL